VKRPRDRKPRISHIQARKAMDEGIRALRLFMGELPLCVTQKTLLTEQKWPPDGGFTGV